MKSIEKWRLTNYLAKVERESGKNANSNNKKDSLNQNKFEFKDGNSLHSSKMVSRSNDGNEEEKKSKITKRVTIQISEKTEISKMASTKANIKAIKSMNKMGSDTKRILK